MSNAKDTAPDLGNKASENAPSSGGDAQGTAKSYAQSAQDTASDYTSKAQQNMPSSGEDAQGTAKSYLQTAQDTASDLTNKAQHNMPSSGEAQQSGKGYLETAQGYAANAADQLSKTVSGENQLVVILQSLILTTLQILPTISRDQALVRASSRQSP